MANTASLGVRILLEDSASLGLGNINGALGNLGLSLFTASNGISGLDPKLKALGLTAITSGALFAGFLGALKFTVDASKELGDAMANIQVYVHGTTDNLDAMQSALIRMSNTSIFTMTQVAQGFSQMGVNGQNATDIINYSGQAMIYLAEAINSDTVPAAELLSLSLQMFHADASEAAHYADILAGSFHNGQGTVENLTNAIKMVGPTAAAANISFEDLNVALDILGQAGLKGSLGATALNYAILSMEAPTTKQADIFQQLGMVVVDQTSPALEQLQADMEATGGAAGKSAKDFDGTYASLYSLWKQAQKIGDVPMNESFVQWATNSGIVTSKFYDASTGTFNLKQALLGLIEGIKGITGPDGLPNAAAQADAIREAFGMRASKGILDFLAQVQNVPGIWDQMEAVLNNTSAQDLADQKTNTLAGKIKELQSSIKDLAALLGKETNSPLIDLINHIDALILKFSQASPQSQAMAEKLLIAGTAISGLVFIVSSLAGTFEALGPLLNGTGTGFLQLLGSLNFLGGATDIVSGGFKNFGQFLKDLVPHIQLIPDYLRHMLNQGPDLIQLFDNLGGFPGIFKKMSLGILDIATSPFAAFDKIGGFPGLFKAGLTGLPELLGSVVGGLGGIGTALITIVGPVVLVIGIIVLIVMLFTNFKKQGMEIVGMFQQTFGPIIKDVITQVTGVVTQLQKIWNDEMPKLKGPMNDLVGAFKSAMPVFQFLGKIVGGVISGIVILLGNLISGFIHALPYIIGVVTSILKIIGNLGQFFVKIFHGDIGGAFGALGDMFKNIGSLIKNYVGLIVSIVWGLVNGIINFFKHLFDVLLGHSIVPDIVAGIKFFFGLLVAVGQWLFNTFIQPLIAAFNLVWDGIKIGIGVVIAIFNVLMGALGAVGQWIINTFINPVKNFFAGLWDGITQGVNNAINTFNNFRDGVTNAIRAVLGPIENLLEGLSKVPGVGGIFGGILNILHSIHLAEGGVVTRPTYALIGEGGEAEAVIPLSKLFGFMAGLQANAQAQNASNTIYLVVDGKTITKVVHNQFTGELTLRGAGRALK